ncbi:MAG: ComF family protein [Candidatus Paceibacterota bacterium]|jgi:ComF family protein
MLNYILNLLFPENCLVCGKKGEKLCLSCINNFPFSERKCFKWIFPIYDYRFIYIKKAIHSFKYKGNKDLAKTFAKATYEKFLEEISIRRNMENFFIPILIPIPLSKKRFFERGYNQAELLARELARYSNGFLKVESDLLKRRTRKTHQAQTKNRFSRFENIKDVFWVKNPRKIENRNIILIDDVVTTGATLHEAKRVLEYSGAKKVIAFTIAH